jgi:hypothetical protein
VVVVIIRVAACEIVRLRVTDAVAGGVAESVTVAFTLNVPTLSVVPLRLALGVPELKLSPAGKPVIVHVYGVVPPLAVTEPEYAVPAVPPVSGEVVVMVSAADANEMEKDRLAERPLASVTVMDTLAVVVEASAAGRLAIKRDFTACADGVPEIVNVVVSALTDVISPAGSPVTVHLNGAFPLVTVIWQV